MSNNDPTENLDARLEQELEAVSQLRIHGRARSALRAGTEVRRLAKAEKKLIPYLNANFHLMTVAQDLLEPEMGRQAAIESIALLESPERARAFQNDYPEREYERTVGWMSACSYDNLAIATASMLGYNSDGVQAIIADGISVCRRTGKLECIDCFREYATNVFRAADDLELALHHARTNLAKPKDGRNSDRRWVGAYDEADLLLLAGHLKPAQQAVMRALELAPSYHSPLTARQKTLVLLNTILLLDGREKEYSALAAPHQAAISHDTPDEGESLSQDLRGDLLEALGDCCRGEYAPAIQTLSQWDKALTVNKCLHEWFEVRLRLIAAMKMSGSDERSSALVSQLETKAREARDFLTLRRLAGLGNPKQPVRPVPGAMAYVSGRFAATPAATAVAPAPESAPAPDAEQAVAAAVPSSEHGPLCETIDRLAGALRDMIRTAHETSTPPDATSILREVLAIPPQSDTNPNDAGRLLHMAPYLVYNGPEISADAQMWDWAQAVAANHPQDARAINLLATLGDALRHRDNSPLTENIRFEDLAAMFRKSLDLEPNASGLWARAGMFYLDNQSFSEAERCLSRASRLDRSEEAVALRLADLYARSDRPNDALLVLDMCLRAGTVTPPVLWEAGLLASSLNRNDLVLLYLDRFETMQPGRLWVGYYRAIALLSLRRANEAVEAIETEAQRAQAASIPMFHVVSVRAAIAAELKNADAVREQIRLAMATPLLQVTNLTPNGIATCLGRLWVSSQALPEHDDLRRPLEDRILASGLVPEALWRQYRAKAPVTPKLSHFRVTLHQPLDESWATSPAVLPGQENWKSYHVTYGVLAADEEQAKGAAVSWQRRCASLPAEVEGVESDNGQYTDRPGVTARRYPQPEGAT